MERWVNDDAVPINFNERFREFGILIRGSDSAEQGIDYCPWCGAKLPESLRDRWFEELESMGLKEPSRETAPEEFLTSEWYVRRGL